MNNVCELRQSKKNTTLGKLFDRRNRINNSIWNFFFAFALIKIDLSHTHTEHTHTFIGKNNIYKMHVFTLKWKMNITNILGIFFFSLSFVFVYSNWWFTITVRNYNETFIEISSCDHWKQKKRATHVGWESINGWILWINDLLFYIFKSQVKKHSTAYTHTHNRLKVNRFTRIRKTSFFAPNLIYDEQHNRTNMV